MPKFKPGDYVTVLEPWFSGALRNITTGKKTGKVLGVRYGLIGYEYQIEGVGIKGLGIDTKKWFKEKDLKWASWAKL